MKIKRLLCVPTAGVFCLSDCQGQELVCLLGKGYSLSLIDFFISCGTGSEFHRMVPGSEVNISFKLMRWLRWFNWQFCSTVVNGKLCVCFLTYPHWLFVCFQIQRDAMRNGHCTVVTTLRRLPLPAGFLLLTLNPENCNVGEGSAREDLPFYFFRSAAAALGKRGLWVPARHSSGLLPQRLFFAFS